MKDPEESKPLNAFAEINPSEYAMLVVFGVFVVLTMLPVLML